VPLNKEEVVEDLESKWAQMNIYMTSIMLLLLKRREVAIKVWVGKTVTVPTQICKEGRMQMGREKVTERMNDFN
jgi:hypothetical protein